MHARTHARMQTHTHTYLLHGQIQCKKSAVHPVQNIAKLSINNVSLSQVCAKASMCLVY